MDSGPPQGFICLNIGCPPAQVMIDKAAYRQLCAIGAEVVRLRMENKRLRDAAEGKNITGQEDS